MDMGTGGVSEEESRAVESFRFTSWIMLRRVGLILGDIGRVLGFITTDPEGEREEGREGGRVREERSGRRGNIIVGNRRERGSAMICSHLWWHHRTDMSLSRSPRTLS